MVEASEGSGRKWAGVDGWVGREGGSVQGVACTMRCMYYALDRTRLAPYLVVVLRELFVLPVGCRERFRTAGKVKGGWRDCMSDKLGWDGGCMDGWRG